MRLCLVSASHASSFSKSFSNARVRTIRPKSLISRWGGGDRWTLLAERCAVGAVIVGEIVDGAQQEPVRLAWRESPSLGRSARSVLLCPRPADAARDGMAPPARRDVPLDSLVASAQQCLDRDPDLIHCYQDNMADIDVVWPPSADNAESKVAEIEVRFGHALWGREHAQAAKCLESGIDALFEDTASTAAWHALWGYCHHLLRDIETTRHYYLIPELLCYNS
jgi:hypothetical protein